MLNTIDILFEFEYGPIDDRFMQIEISANEQTLLVNTANEVLVRQISLPSSISLKFSGKTPGRDTKIDSAGNIVQDMYVKLLGLKIDNLKVPEWVIQKRYLILLMMVDI